MSFFLSSGNKKSRTVELKKSLQSAREPVKKRVLKNSKLNFKEQSSIANTIKLHSIYCQGFLDIFL